MLLPPFPISSITVKYIDKFYYQVMMNVAFYINVLGSPLQSDGNVPLFDGIVTYPYIWLGDPAASFLTDK